MLAMRRIRGENSAQRRPARKHSSLGRDDAAIPANPPARRSVIMAIDIYDQVVPVMQKMLSNLSTILQKAESYAQARKIDPAALLQARLYPDMFTFTRQVQIASDFVKSTPSRLAGVEV